MKEINCNIIKDLLPLYADDVVCEDTKELVDEHLQSCDNCRKELADIKKDVVIPTTPQVQQENAQVLKEFKKGWRKKGYYLCPFILFTLVVLAGFLFLFVLIGLPVSSEDVVATTEFQYQDPDFSYAYLNQAWVLHFELPSGKGLNDITLPVYDTTESGEKVIIGYKMYLFEVPLSWRPSNLTLGYGYDGTTPPDEDFDFTYTVVYKDKEVVYSMVEEGLFVPQETVTYFD